MKTRKSYRAGFVILVAAGCLFAFWYFNAYREKRFDKEIVAAAQHYSVDPALIKAVIWRESRFDPWAEGRAGETGLMQIRDIVFGEWATAEKIPRPVHEAGFNPTTNTMAGAWYLGKLLKRYRQADDAIPYALADYNAGRSHVLDWLRGEAATNNQIFIEKIGFPKTQAYVIAIQHRRENYRHEFEMKP